MINKQTAALKLALAALEGWGKGFPDNWGDLDTEAVTAIREALEQPAQQQEPKQSEIFCGVDFADGLLSVSVFRRRDDDVAELLHAEQIEFPAQQQEPVAWMDGYRNIYSLEEKAAGCEDAVIPLVPATLQHWSDCAVHNEPAYPAGKCDCGGYTSPPASKPWVGLTDGERLDAERLADQQYVETRGQELRPSWASLFCRDIEAKLKEKNNG